LAIIGFVNRLADHLYFAAGAALRKRHARAELAPRPRSAPLLPWQRRHTYLSQFTATGREVVHVQHVSLFLNDSSTHIYDTVLRSTTECEIIRENKF
jgi:hypothetical protein